MHIFRHGLRLLAAVTVSFVLVAPAPAIAGKLLRASDAGLHRVDSTQASDGEAAMVLRLATPDGQLLDLVLVEHTALMQDARAHVPQVRDGTTQVFAGDVAGRSGSWLRLTRIGDAWLGAVLDGEKLWFLDPASHHRELATRIGVDAGATLVYTLADLAQPLDFHGDTPADHTAHAAAAGAWMPSPVRGGTDQELRLTLVMDTEFQDLYDAPASVALAALNVVDGFYTSQVDTRIRLHYLLALTDNGPLTTTSYADLLDAFGDFVNDKRIPLHGLAHLLSGKDFDGAVIGYAWINGLCSRTKGFGVNQMTGSGGSNATLLAHEMGHNFGARHDNQISLPIGLTSAFVTEYCSHNFIMWPSINATDPATEFSPCSMIWFKHYPQSQHCLVPVDLLFIDDFEPALP